MTKENTLYRTHEIKSNILFILKTPIDKLYFQIKDNQFQKFKEIFEKHKIKIELTDSNGNSLLNIAVRSNSYEVAQFLLNSGADVNSQNVKNKLLIFY